MALLHTTVIVIVTLLVVYSHSSAGQDMTSYDKYSDVPVPVEYCEGSTFEAECGDDEVVVMYAARYGRMRVGKCLTMEGGDMGCNTNVLALLDMRCSGQHSCHVRVSSIIDAIPDDQQPCSRNFRSFLEASYSCVKTIIKPQEACIGKKHMEITEQSGYLASIVTDETTCGSIDAPWVLNMNQGQTVQIELYDFAVSTRVDADFTNDVPGVCHVYAIIKERDGKTSETICGSHERRSVAFQSSTNILEIRLVTKRKTTENGYFLLKYTAKGCPDPVAPSYGWVQRTGSQAIFGCNATSEQWRMTCEGDTWHGDWQNCTRGPAVTGHLETAFMGIFSGSQWASIVIILAIAVTLGLIIFLVGLVVLRRRCILGASRAGGYRDGPPPQDLYSPQYRDNTSTTYGTKGLSNMDCSNSENDYYRTWQLQRHPPGGRLYPGAGAHGSYTSTGNDDTMESSAHAAGMVCTNPRCAHRPYDTMDAERRQQPVEHIYESPKFDRRDIVPPPPAPPQSHAPNTTTGGPSTQYFELDPDQV